MIEYVCLGTDDEAAAQAFYTAALAPLGYVPLGDHGGFGPPGGPPRLWLGNPLDGGKASFGNGTMVCFTAPSRSAVDAFHAACLSHGGTDEGRPGIRRYAPDWYAAYARDPDGNKLSAVFRG